MIINTKPMESRFDYKSTEEKWRNVWKNNKYGSSKKTNGDKFTMVIPPPNVTGKLHMGHGLNNTLMDICVRVNILQGKDSILIPGTDHAGIATQTKVEKMLLEQGITKESLGKDKFMEKIHEWKEDNGGAIVTQLKEMGCLYDWDHEHFTMEPKFSKLVTEMFTKLYNDGLIYQSKYIINWCPKHQTALANDEVVHTKVKSNMYYIKYKCLNSDGIECDDVVIATTRPETLFGDTAIAYNPEDSRYTHLKNCKAIVPFVNRQISFIEDDYVKPELGTGLVKITPSHDFNDFAMGKRHNLQFIDVLDKYAHIINTGTEFDGMFKMKARKIVIHKLTEMGQLDKVLPHDNTNGTCYRCNDTIEPLISNQWFVKMKPLAEKAQKSVNDGKIEFIPKHQTKIFNNWMDNVQDWCISRQIWWGHRIPIWYNNDDGSILCQETSPGDNYTQDPDVLDTWFSSWLWPFGVIEEDEFTARYPTDLLITGSDILFFWVARMIMASEYLHTEIPFKKVYFHGIVRDENGEKMSKSKGNVIDPMTIMEHYGADAMRFVLTMFTPVDKDIKYSPQTLKVSRNFLTKLWNTVRFYLMTFKDKDIDVNLRDKSDLKSADVWIIDKFNTLNIDVKKHIINCNFAEYASEIHNFVFNVFCSDYLEYCKTMDVNKTSHYVFKSILEGVLIMLHPIIPFITEELWSKLSTNESILDSKWPEHIVCFSDDTNHMVIDFTSTLNMLALIRKKENVDITSINCTENIDYLSSFI